MIVEKYEHYELLDMDHIQHVFLDQPHEKEDSEDEKGNKKK